MTETIKHKSVTLHISTYNALPTTARCTNPDGTRSVLINGVWKPVELDRSKK